MTKATNKATSTATNASTENKEVIQSPAAANTSAEVIQSAAPAAVSKADKARAVFAEAYPDGKTTKMQRKDIIAAMVQRAGLTPAGAATYLQNFKDKAGITVKRAPVAANQSVPAAA